MTQESIPGGPGQEVTRVSTPDGSIVVEHEGDPGSPDVVVFLHGLTANRSTWRRVATNLGHEYRLLLLDALARGQSDGAPRARFDLESEARRLVRTLQVLGVRAPVLVGHSHGAAVAVAAAAAAGARGLLLVNPVTPDVRRPALLGALQYFPLRTCLPGVVGLFRRPLTHYMLVRRVFTGREPLPPGAVARYSEPWADSSRARSLPAILGAWDPSELAAWAPVSGVPASILAGGRDRRIRPDFARKWAATLGARFELYEECGHGLPEESPEITARALRALLAKVNRKQEEGDHA